MAFHEGRYLLRTQQRLCPLRDGRRIAAEPFHRADQALPCFTVPQRPESRAPQTPAQHLGAERGNAEGIRLLPGKGNNAQRMPELYAVFLQGLKYLRGHEHPKGSIQPAAIGNRVVMRSQHDGLLQVLAGPDSPKVGNRVHLDLQPQLLLPAVQQPFAGLTVRGAAQLPVDAARRVAPHLPQRMEPLQQARGIDPAACILRRRTCSHYNHFLISSI